MQKTHISKTVTRTVILGSHSFADTLTVTSTGVVTPVAAGADGIVGRQSDDDVTNRGSIVAATAIVGGNGGVGIDLTAGGTILNRGSITGGYTAATSGTKGVEGGNGVDSRGGTITNSGTISGGSLYRGDNTASQGGTGVDATQGSVTIMNSGTILGGEGSWFYKGYGSTTGGVGVDLAGGMLSSAGTIEGGYTAYGRGVAVELAQHGTLVNHGTIFGGNERTGGAVVSVNSQVTNYGTIQGFGRYYYAHGGALGVEITGGSLVNNGDIAGGDGNALDHYQYAPPGAGLDASGAVISNAGTIMGGSRGTYGGTGVILADHASLNNSGMLIGGSGSYGYQANAGYAGGVGISLGAETNATNSGIIQGGIGGGYDARTLSNGGYGGAGVILAANSTLTNTGTLSGGAGNYGIVHGGNGGDGADINAGTLITSGTIIGGAGGMSYSNYGQAGDAVNFGNVAGTMIVDPGAVFDGAIAGNDSVNDTLVLAGTSAGTLAGFGATITGITTISEDAGGNWTLQGKITGPGEIDIGKGAQLTLSNGPVSISTIDFASGGHATLTLGSPAGVTSTFVGFGKGDSIDLTSVQGTALSYNDGTLSVLGANNAVVATLDFAGNYTLADFTLHTNGGNTDVLYAGGLPDFLPFVMSAEPNPRDTDQFVGGPRLDTADTLTHPWLLHR